MKTASFTDGNISHTVHTREEAWHLLNRYWPEDPEVEILKLAAQLSAACMKYGSPHVIVWYDDSDNSIVHDVDGEPDEIAELIHIANLGLIEKLTEAKGE